MSEEGTENAVEILDMRKSYGSGFLLGAKRTVVIENFNMHVKKGTIYGLLGPSGAGKTTLLRCILGRLQPDAGEIQVLGLPPNTRGHGIPGSLVGYMPQELALYDKFTIQNTMNYFGRLHNMTSKEISDRTTFLVKFLNLPEQSRRVSNMSGGQQRRLSLAVALLHQPRLLILDEPTVGVDPLLRMKIWEYLVKIVRISHTTIMITTHYIEEARLAHTVGLLRGGKLLAEGPPDTLLQAHNLPTLEDVFLKLCYAQDVKGSATRTTSTHLLSSEDRRPSYGATDTEPSNGGVPAEVELTKKGMRSPSVQAGGTGDRTMLLAAIDQESDTGSRWLEDQMTNHHVTLRQFKTSSIINLMRLYALIGKNLTILRSNLLQVAFTFLLPAIQIVVFCEALGTTPTDLHLAVCNTDRGAFGRNLGNDYLNHINNDTIDLDRYHSYDTALSKAKTNDAWGVVQIKENFTTDIIKRYLSGSNVTNSTIDGSNIHVRLDYTNSILATTIQKALVDAYQAFAKDLIASSGMHINPDLLDIPVKFEKPIYGHPDDSFTNYMAAGVLITITYFLSVGLTALSFVIERKLGLLDRTWAAGANSVEMLLGHTATQLLVMTVQVVVLFSFAFGVFDIRIEGSFVPVLALCILQGLTGMMMGFCISATCEEESSAIQVALGTFYPTIMISGIMWPIEGMPMAMRQFSKILPQTLPASSIRAILGRGWDITYQEVWLGFVITFAWMLGYFLFAAVAIKIRMK